MTQDSAMPAQPAESAGPGQPAEPPRRKDLVWRFLQGRDEFGFALVLILATISVRVVPSSSALGTFLGAVCSGGTLLFVLHTADARPRTMRVSAVVVAIAIVGSALPLLFGGTEWSTGAANGVGLMLALVVPLVILRRILLSPTITVQLVLGALCIYLLIGLAYSYGFMLIAVVQGGSFFVQLSQASTTDYVYFSYVTLTTVGYGDLTAATDLGRLAAVSDALVGQLYLVSAVALLVGNIGRSISVRDRAQSADRAGRDLLHSGRPGASPADAAPAVAGGPGSAAGADGTADRSSA